MRDKRNKAEKFKVYAVKGKPEYYRTWVFDTLDDMYVYADKYGLLSQHHGFEALTHSFRAYKLTKNGKKGKMLPVIGDVMFYKGCVEEGVVSHEMTHAATYYAHLKNWKFSFALKDKNWRKIDEKYAWMQGYMVNQLWRKYKGSKEKY